MIGRLFGKLIHVAAPTIMVDVNGVGYEVATPMTTIYRLGPLDSVCTIYTHLAVSETAQQLYGFYELRERDLFRTLIKVNGVGPKMALAILSTLEADEFVRTVHSDDLNRLVKVPGVGKKTAERLLIEMRDRLKDWQVGNIPTALEQAVDDKEAKVSADVVAEAESALVALGYKPTQAAKLIQSVYENGMSSDQIIRQALRSLA